MAFEGMDDTQAVSAAGHNLQTKAGELQSIVHVIDGMVHSIRGGAWVGSDAERFVADWTGYRQTMISTQQSIHQMGQTAVRNAAEQEAASR